MKKCLDAECQLSFRPVLVKKIPFQEIEELEPQAIYDAGEPLVGK
jgi:hypothetical protein